MSSMLLSTGRLRFIGGENNDAKRSTLHSTIHHCTVCSNYSATLNHYDEYAIQHHLQTINIQYMLHTLRSLAV